LRLDRPAFVFEGDRVAIRDWAERTTLAGGIVLDTAAAARGLHGAARRRHLTRRAGAPDDATAWIESLLERDTFAGRQGLLVRSAFSEAEIGDGVSRLVASGIAAVAGDGLWLADAWASLLQRAGDAIDAEHRQHPDRHGVPLPELKSAVAPMEANAFDALVVGLGTRGFVRDGSVVRRATHRPVLPQAIEETASDLRARLAANPFDPPSRGVLAPDATAARALRFLLETGEAVEVGAGLVMTAEHVARARELVAAVIRERGEATLADIRARLACSRRVLVPLLEYLDRTGLTVRHGETRSLRR
jgi:selenocysteine-specific elongation factor